MKYYIIAGEASGDLHGANLVKQLHLKDPQAQIWGWGGDAMEQQGVTLRKHYQDLAFMGFIEVVKNIRTIFRNLTFCKKDILDFKPDVLILIDYPGFNLRIAKWAKQQGIRVFYYISPQIWAWHKSRIHQIKANIERMFVILPFEKDFYAQYDYAVDFVGHPLLDALQQKKAEEEKTKIFEKGEKPIIALLPGSRKQEIDNMLSVMLSVVDFFPQYEFVIAAAPSQPLAFYQRIVQEKAHIRIVSNQTYSLLSHAHAALVTSGTATLETALHHVPQVVCYKGSPISYWIAKKVVTLKFISLVNLISDREIVKELIQNDLTTENLRQELTYILGGEERENIRKGYNHLITLLGNEGASERTADLIIQYL